MYIPGAMPRLMALLIISINSVAVSIAQNKINTSPYAMFGDNSKMLEAEHVAEEDVFQVLLLSEQGDTCHVCFDFKEGTVTVSDQYGEVVLLDRISESAKARFLTMDPLAEKYYNVNPYVYCMNNPTRYVDPDGREIWIYYNDEYGNQQEFMYHIGMTCNVNDQCVQAIVSNLNLMSANPDGCSVISSLLESPTKYGYMQADTHSEMGDGYFSKNTIYLNDPRDTMTFAEETFHGYQYYMGQGGKTAVNEVDAKLFSSKMNLEIDIWQQEGRYIKNLSGIADNCYGDCMANLLFGGFNIEDYRYAVNSFFKGKLCGETYEQLGYTIGTISPEPLIKRFLPVK